MRDLLFLSHRLPFPPNKGDKIRAWHVLQHLAARHRVYLGCFVDDNCDWQHVPLVRDLCADTCIVALDRRRATLRGIRSLLGKSAITLPYYFDATIARWVRGLLGCSPTVFVFSSAMAQYAVGPRSGAMARIIDFVDVDSEKWRAYAAEKLWPSRLVYRREANALQRFERAVAQQFDASIFVSDAEMQSFGKIAPESVGKTFLVRNGVDGAYFLPNQQRYPDPYDGRRDVICFTGTMDYWPNIAAATWFARSILPRVQWKHPQATFWIVGANPTGVVANLAKHPAITVTGRVADIRPYLAHARAVVAPLRIARGIQNKVLEAMAMGKAVVATPQALEGIGAEQDSEALVASTEEQFAAAVERVLDGRVPELGARARRLIDQKFDWAANLVALDGIIERAERRANGSAQSKRSIGHLISEGPGCER
jgi:sugar transferase (PEP-CTERM/EpsH1 system associated)